MKVAVSVTFFVVITCLLAVGLVYAQDPAAGAWQATNTADAPVGRYGHTALAVNGKMLMWGGAFHLNQFRNDGYWYDPAIDTWTPISTDNAPVGRLRHTAIWTGDKMIVWGGEYSGGGVTTNTGGIYDPATDSWESISLVNAPSPREMHSAVWTGTEMIVWGGCSTISCSQIFNDGGRYNPATDTWTPIAGDVTLTPRYLHRAFWTGTEMIVWGGTSDPQGMSYDPSTESWHPISTVNAPTPTFDVANGVWTGKEMLVWGGCTTVSTSGCGTSYVNSGGRYNPATDTWTPISATDAPAARKAHSTVWTGQKMVVWGGCGDACYDTGGAYDPKTDTWEALDTTNAPASRSHHVGIWTGAEMVVWSGCTTTLCGNAVYLTTGGRLTLPEPPPDFEIIPVSPPWQISQGLTMTQQVALTSSTGLTSPIAITLSGAPGIESSLTPAAAPPGSSVTLRLTAAMTSTIGDYNLTITGNTSVPSSTLSSAALSPLTRTATVSLTVLPAPHITPTIIPTVRTIYPGQSTSYTVSLTATAEFTQAMMLLLDQLPPDTTYSFTPPKIAPGDTSSLIISSTTSTPPGVHQLAVTSQLVNLTQTIYPTLVVKQRLFLPLIFKEK